MDQNITTSAKREELHIENKEMYLLIIEAQPLTDSTVNSPNSTKP